MKQLTLLFVLFWRGALVGQISEECSKVLASRDFVAFSKYVDDLSVSEGNTSAYWELMRDLTPGFQEGAVVITKQVPDPYDPNVRTLYTSVIQIITTPTLITYFEVSEKKNKKIDTGWEAYLESVEKFRDEQGFETLKAEFREVFGAELAESDLFDDHLVYGSYCSYEGLKPAGREQVDTWVAAKNKLEMLKWLRSANCEKQVYAIDGLFQLAAAGIPISSDEGRIINFICSKSGTLSVCSGCIYSRRDIRSVTKKFAF